MKNVQKKFRIVVDVALCHDCNNCFLACKDEHWDNENLPISVSTPRHGHRWMDLFTKERGQTPLQDVATLPHPCQHCDNAPCIKAGEGAVYKREDGIVIIDPVKAVGKKLLLDACPYHVIFWNDEKNIPQKCTGCAHLLDAGWKEPRCVQICPTGALSFAMIDDDSMEKRIKEENLEVFHPEHGTKPSVFYKNLYRYTKCHVAGSIAFDEGRECAEGANVVLTNLKTSQSQEVISNNYGDFKIDNLDENSGDYKLEVDFNGDIKTLMIALKESVNVGTIIL